MAEVDAGAVAPVVPASMDAPAPESTADQVTEAPEGEAKPETPERTFTQKEVDEIAAKRAARAERSALKVARAEAEAALLRRQLEDLQRQQQQPSAQPAGKPHPSQFQDYESYTEALTEWKLDQRLAKEREESKRASEAEQQQRFAQQRAQSVQTNIVAVGAAKYSDFTDVVTAEGVAISPAMLAAAERLKDGAGAEVLYHLGQNPEESQRIAALPDIDQVWELKDLATKLKAAPAPTRTPAPIVPNQAPAAVAKDPSKMTDKEFAEWRQRQKAQRR